MPETTIVEGGIVVTMDGRRRVLKDGAVAIEPPYITDVGKSPEVRANHRAATRIDAKGHLVLPGLIDAHEHSTQMLARGLADDLDLGPWLYDRILPYESAMTPDDVFSSSVLCCIEMVRNGTTTFADPGGYHMERVAEAVEKVGARGVISYASVDTDISGAKLPKEVEVSTDACMKRTESLLRACDGMGAGRVRVSASLRGDALVSRDLVEATDRFAREHGLIVQMHAANTRERVEQFEKVHKGKGVVEYFDSIGVLGPHWLLAHLAFLRDEQVKRIAMRGVSVCHNPGSSLHGGYGASRYGKFPELLAQGANVCLGCDAAAANNSLDMFMTMRQAATVHKEARASASYVSPEQALEMATVRGAAALHDESIGSIEVGKRADLILVGLNKPNSTPLHDFSIVQTIVYSLTGSDVETVMVDGKVIMDRREVLTVDANRAVRTGQKASERIISRAGLKLSPRWPTA